MCGTYYHGTWQGGNLKHRMLQSNIWLNIQIDLLNRPPELFHEKTREVPDDIHAIVLHAINTYIVITT